MSWTAQAQNSCRSILNFELQPEVQNLQPIRLRDGDTYWGYYTCSSYDSAVSAMPDANNEQQCKNCGKPHTDESYRPPAVFRKGGELYLVDPGRLSKDLGMQQLAESGATNQCVFCGNSHFTIDLGCPSCGASIENPSEVRSNLRSSVSVLATTGLDAPPQTPSQDPATQSATRSKRSRLMGALAGATMLVATSIGAVWGTSTYTLPAEVVQVSQHEVTVEYENRKGETKHMSLDRPEFETQAWRVGEDVDLYFVNWRLGAASGGERQNGDVLAPSE